MRSAHRHSTRLALALGAIAGIDLLLPAAAAAATPPGGIVLAFLGLPSLHTIIKAIAGGFFGALASALVPGWLRHATVATIQQLVALPDPGTWSHVAALQSEMTYLGAMLAPVTLAAAVLRYWALGLTGSAHPVTAVARSGACTGVLVAYRWIVDEVVAATNTLTHGILGLPSVSGGLGRIIGVLFGGALLTGSGGVFGALLVIVGVILAAGLFAAQVLLTVVLALLVVSGPPLIALAAVPELSHLALAWRDALLAVALVPLGWTVLFATAGALCLDASSFTGGIAGLPGAVAAAFAGLITFALALKLPLMLLGELRGVLSRPTLKASAPAGPAPSVPGAERIRSSQARMRAVALAGAPAIGASVGRAAGALGAPAGGPLGAARRALIRGAARGGGHEPGTSRAHTGAGPLPTRARGRVAAAGAILASAPAQAAEAMRRYSSRETAERAYPRPARSVSSKAGSRARAANAQGAAHASADSSSHAPTRGARGRTGSVLAAVTPTSPARPEAARAAASAPPAETGARVTYLRAQAQGPSGERTGPLPRAAAQVSRPTQEAKSRPASGSRSRAGAAARGAGPTAARKAGRSASATGPTEPQGSPAPASDRGRPSEPPPRAPARALRRRPKR